MNSLQPWLIMLALSPVPSVCREGWGSTMVGVAGGEFTSSYPK